MTETFRVVEPLSEGALNMAAVYAERYVRLCIGVECLSFTVAEARALHRWLTAALPPVKEPCKHLHILPPSRWDPKSMCIDCGATLP